MSGLSSPTFETPTEFMINRGVVLPIAAYRRADEAMSIQGIDPLEAFSESEHGRLVRVAHYAVALYSNNVFPDALAVSRGEERPGFMIIKSDQVEREE